jgi:hypothetical protein
MPLEKLPQHRLAYENDIYNESDFLARERRKKREIDRVSESVYIHYIRNYGSK